MLSLKFYSKFILIFLGIYLGFMATPHQALATVNYTITATQGANGYISPSGVTTLTANSSAIYTIIPDGGYAIATVTVDGYVNKTTTSNDTSYTVPFNYVSANHTISATFVPSTYTITATTTSTYGTIAPAGTVAYPYLASQNYTVTASTGNLISAVSIDAAGQKITTSNDIVFTHPFTSINANHVITASFAPIIPKITATAGANGSISPSGVTSLTYNGSQTYTIKPASSTYLIGTVTIDGAAQTINSSNDTLFTHTFSSVITNHTISATFIKGLYTVSISAGSHGTISGPATIAYQASQTYTVTPDKGYAIATVTIDGLLQKTTSSNDASFTHTFSNVNSNHSIAATFVPSSYTIVASTTSTNGVITPSGTAVVAYLGSEAYTIKPDTGYMISAVSIDGKGQSITATNDTLFTYTFASVSINHSISAAFAPIVPKITATAGANGSISPAGTTSVPYNTSVTYSIKPASTSYLIGTVTIDGAAQTINSSNDTLFTHTFPNVVANHTISATFITGVYTITAGQGANGSVLPAGKTAVAYLGSQTYTVTPDSGYDIATVTIDGVVTKTTASNDTAFTKIFSSVSANHTISASFVPSSYTITATTSNTFGAISPAGTQAFAFLAFQTYTVTPNTGYMISAVSIDGKGQSITASNDTVFTHAFTSISANHTIVAAFAPIVPKITATAGADGTISPAGTTSVTYNGSETYTIKPVNSSYLIGTVTIDGAAQTINSSNDTLFTHIFSNVITNHTISATFIPSAYSITATQTANGSVSPAGKTAVAYLGSQTYTVTSDSGYDIGSVTIDGVTTKTTVANDTSYTKTFSSVSANHTISASFVPSTYTVTATTTDTNGTISPSGISAVSYMGSLTYSVIPNSGYVVSSVSIDGVSQTITSSNDTLFTHTFSNVEGNHSIIASFMLNDTTIVTTFYNNALSNNNLPNLSLFNSAIAAVKSLEQSNPSQGAILLSLLSSDLYALGKNNIDTFYNNAIANNNVSNAALLSNAMTNINFVSEYLPGAAYNSANTTIYVTTGLQNYLANQLYNLAKNSLTNIGQNAADLQIAINDVNLLKPYTGYTVDGVTYYNYLVNQLISNYNSALQKAGKLNFTYASQLSASNSLSSDVAIDAAGNVYVSAPSPASSNIGFGLIYELQKSPAKIVTIAPSSPIEGDHFGRVFAVSGNILVASSEPTNKPNTGDARVYVFSYNTNKWVQSNIIDVANVLGFDVSKTPINQISLAVSQSLATSVVGSTNVTLISTLVVGVPGYGKYVIIDNSSTTAITGAIPTNLFTSNLPLSSAWTEDVIASFTSNNSATTESFAANGNYVVVGVPSQGLVGIIQRSAGSSSHLFNWTATDLKSVSGYGASVAVSQGTATVTVAIGSPNENNGSGSVYTKVGTINAQTNVTTWAAQQAVSLFMPTTVMLAGSQVALNGNILMVGAKPGIVMDYKLNSSNVWSWAYTNGAVNSSIINSLATDGTTTVIGDQYTGSINCSGSALGSCPESNVETLQP